ncbi:MAG: cation:proton antiporter [Gammaproteobacteria bacterium]|nr:cation:proton antiporter [Gammaproteobacteria bacterium]
MTHSSVVFAVFVVFAGAAVLATAALFARQAMIVAYIVIGTLLGPGGLGLVRDAGWLHEVSEIGIMFLLYLLGLNMVPRQLLQMLKEALEVTLGSALAFALLGAGIAFAAGFEWRDALITGAAMMFSSTIIGLKLLPTTALHHQHTGQVMISVLLLQDLIAILVLLLIEGLSGSGGNGLALKLLALPLLIAVASVLERWVVEPLLQRFDQIHEYLFLVVIAWCLSIAELARFLGLSHEIGAFIAGVSLAACPVSMFVADSLRPLRDFFLILFFFSLGASLDLVAARETLLPAVLLAAVMLAAKPIIFKKLLTLAGESHKLAQEAGIRLGQISEFSLLITVLALESGFVSAKASNLIQVAAILSFIGSSYLIVMRYPTPIAVRENLRRD